MNLKDLSPEQRAALKEEIAAEEKAEEARKEAERKVYKELGQKKVADEFDLITKVSNELSLVKGRIFREFMALVDIKSELYEVRSTQKSHTWTNANKDKRITIGFRVYDRWDDTVNAGIAKVKEYLNTLAKDGDSAKIMRVVNNLLKRDNEGNLKASRVLELISLKDEIENETFKDGVSIIEKSHYQEQSAYYVEAEYRDDQQKWNSVPLAISSADFPEEDRKQLFPDEDPVKETESK